MSNSPESNSEWVLETTDATFELDVVERSKEVPVVVDFWAEWCGPCRMLGPILDSLATEYAGKFVLVKADTEQCPQAAGGFQVSSIPAVFALVNGEPVDTFLGVLPEEQLRPWLDRVVQLGVFGAAERLEEEAPAEAEAKYRELAEAAPRDPAPRIGLARVLVAQDRPQEARAVIAELEERGYLEPEAKKIKTQLELSGSSAHDVDKCRAAVVESPEDRGLQLQLAEALAARQAYPEALDICLTLVQQDRHGAGEEGRQMMVDIMSVLPDDSELVTEYRRKLSLALY